MRKRELVHIHALLDRVGRFMQMRGDLERGALEEYTQLDVGSAAVFRSKGAHETAVTTLSEALAAAIGKEADDDEGPDDPSSASVEEAEGTESAESTASETRHVDARSD